MKKIIVIIVILLITDIIPAQELSRYSCIADRIDISGFESCRTFDNDGIILSKGIYHPLSIVQYGVLAYYYYLNTLDSSYYYKCVNQVKYFKDTTKVNILFEGKGIGLPYNFNFWDMKAPWYSGMTQGYAISYLLRYYELTKDKSVFPIIKKITYVLVMPQEDGGTISTTKEGCTWIEEYPNSKRSPQVLNGYINGIIGLKEYCTYFSEDTLSKRLLDETYECLKNSLEYFDTPTWSYYNRKNKTLSNIYLRYQIYEMKDLYEIFHEPLFDHQMRIWAVFSYNKFIKKKSTLYKFANHNISLPVKKIDDNMYGIQVDSNQILITDSLEAERFKTWRELKKHLKGQKNRKLKNKPSKLTFFAFNNPKPIKTNYAEIIFNESILCNYSISVFKKPEKKRKKLVDVDYSTFCSNNSLFLSYNELSVSDLIIKLENKNKVAPEIINIDFYNTSLKKPPFFAYNETKSFHLEKGVNYMITFPLSNTDKAVIFYKYAANEKSLAKSKWKAHNTLSINESFTPDKSGVYNFLIVYDWKNPLSMIGEFDIKPINDINIDNY